MRLSYVNLAFVALLCSHVVYAAVPVGTIATIATVATKTTSTTTIATLVTRTTTTASTTTTVNGAQQTRYGQCGGTGYTGPTVCAPGNVCKFTSVYYSQCLPGTVVTTTTIPTTSIIITATTAANRTTTTPSTTTPSKTTTSTNPTLTLDPIFVLSQPRQVDMLLNIKGLYGLPQLQQVSESKLNVSNIQCDILVGMQKNLEWFVFFHINNATSFKYKLHNTAWTWITPVSQMMPGMVQPQVAVNLAFSQTGLNTIGYGANMFDTPFQKGMWADATNLGDANPNSNWLPVFQGTDIHGVWLFASDNVTLLQYQVLALNNLFGPDITTLYTLNANSRPPPYAGHEMFGWLDGIGQPHIDGFGTLYPGQANVNAGIILAGENGDTLANVRPAWTFDGSFMAFRQLKQLVPEFNLSLLKNAPWIPGWTTQQSADLLGSRMVGRWQSGAPIDNNPMVDAPGQGPDPNVNNAFDYSHTAQGYNIATDQYHCPFSAHIRKNRPRADEQDNTNLVMRAGIPYGPEVTSSEASQYVSDPNLERGLAFVGYQSQIAQGYQFMQTQWMNQPNFPPAKNETPGWDPIMGENHGAARFMSGYDIEDASLVLNLPTDFVIPRGGEYFFSPSIPAIRDVLSM